MFNIGDKVTMFGYYKKFPSEDDGYNGEVGRIIGGVTKDVNNYVVQFNGLNEEFILYSDEMELYNDVGFGELK